MAVSATLCAGSPGLSTILRAAKSMPPVIRPMGGMIRSLTRLVTILPNAPPMTTATARSTTFPRWMKSRNSVKTDTQGFLVSIGVEPRPQLLAAFEERNVLGAHLNGRPRAWIAPGPGRSGPNRKGAEAAQLHAPARLQR